MQNAAARKTPRRSNIELLRILSMLLIVLHHYAVHGNVSFSGDDLSFGRFFHGALMCMGALGDDIFVLISAYFLVESPFRLRRLLRLWGEVVFYAVTVTLVGWLLAPPSGGVSVKALLSMVAPVLTGKYWFVTAYVMLVLLSPFLNKMLHALTRREMGRLFSSSLCRCRRCPRSWRASWAGASWPRSSSCTAWRAISAFIRTACPC